ncbi:MAG: hypothetical protein JWM74_4757 [Myxococcaceae bacterium]|nr:hypothetical protein [Myxococcaceae bacterium]
MAFALAACGGDDAATTTSTDDGGGASTTDPASIEDARAYNLTRINALRAAHGRAALVRDDALDTFAQAASTELAKDHSAHQYFKDKAAKCGCGVQAETQGAASGWPAAPVKTQIDQILDAMMKEGPGGGHYEAILGARYTRLGVGLVGPGGTLYFTNDFGS